ncbi:hypothetical protein [Vogesella indigofera]|nr:hypothetical protein [Vogesella indigofera]MDC7710845.1 hypothetical protein [Vogesella indigofera]
MKIAHTTPKLNLHKFKLIAKNLIPNKIKKHNYSKKHRTSDIP